MENEVWIKMCIRDRYLTEGEQNRQKDVKINGTSEIYSKLIFQ